MMIDGDCSTSLFGDFIFFNQMKLTLQERYYIFLSICLVWIIGYQSYHNYQNDKLIHESIEEGNKRVNRYIVINNELREENLGLKHNLTYEQATHHASKNHVKMLEGQITVVGDYYRKEITKVKDELFDLKHKKK